MASLPTSGGEVEYGVKGLNRQFVIKMTGFVIFGKILNTVKLTQPFLFPCFRKDEISINLTVSFYSRDNSNVMNGA
jgi:hypothetical protein